MAGRHPRVPAKRKQRQRHEKDAKGSVNPRPTLREMRGRHRRKRRRSPPPRARSRADRGARPRSSASATRRAAPTGDRQADEDQGREQQEQVHRRRSCWRRPSTNPRRGSSGVAVLGAAFPVAEFGQVFDDGIEVAEVPGGGDSEGGEASRPRLRRPRRRPGGSAGEGHDRGDEDARDEGDGHRPGKEHRADRGPRGERPAASLQPFGSQHAQRRRRRGAPPPAGRRRISGRNWSLPAWRRRRSPPGRRSGGRPTARLSRRPRSRAGRRKKASTTKPCIVPWLITSSGEVIAGTRGANGAWLQDGFHPAVDSLGLEPDPVVFRRSTGSRPRRC